MTILRRRFLAMLVALALVATARDSECADDELPAKLLGDFIVNVASYDKSFRARARASPRARVVVLQRGDDNGSIRVAGNVAHQLGARTTIAGLPMDVEIVAAGTPAELATLCRDGHVALLVFSTGFGDQLPAMATALEHVDVLTFGVVGGYAASGAVIALGIQEGRPRMIVNLARARLQNVSFDAGLLRLAEVLR